jgi:hypothetical protein
LNILERRGFVKFLNEGVVCLEGVVNYCGLDLLSEFLLRLGLELLLCLLLVNSKLLVLQDLQTGVLLKLVFGIELKVQIFSGFLRELLVGVLVFLWDELGYFGEGYVFVFVSGLRKCPVIVYVSRINTIGL